MQNLVKITPLQMDPKQQELGTHLRPRLDLGPPKSKEPLALQYRSEKVPKNMCFVDRATEVVAQKLFLQAWRPKIMKNVHFIKNSLGNRQPGCVHRFGVCVPDTRLQAL